MRMATLKCKVKSSILAEGQRMAEKSAKFSSSRPKLSEVLRTATFVNLPGRQFVHEVTQIMTRVLEW